jgi:hypothetical protein
MAQMFIFVPSVARFREDYLMARLERAQIASLALLTSEETINEKLELELLRSADVESVVLLRDETRQLILSSQDTSIVAASFDLREPTALDLMGDALSEIVFPTDGLIRVTGEPINEAGLLIEITLPAAPMRSAMLEFSLRILIISVMVSAITASLLFIAARSLLVLPIQRMGRHMTSYAEAPEDANRIIEPNNTVKELLEAETSLNALQTRLTSELKQRERLAQLGQAVAKISHDLRNMLSVATLMADRLENSKDPAVQRATPKIIASLSRAIHLTEATLAYGKAEEPAPKLTRFVLNDLVQDIIESDRLVSESSGKDINITYETDIDCSIMVRADPEQLHRVISNLVKNAREAIALSFKPGTISIKAAEREGRWMIEIKDTGPGLPQKAKDHLFQPFQGGVRQGGTGLGLAISSEIMRAHAGKLELVESSAEGTTFRLCLPAGLAT